MMVTMQIPHLLSYVTVIREEQFGIRNGKPDMFNINIHTNSIQKVYLY
jgi:hypothetical protein